MMLIVCDLGRFLAERRFSANMFLLVSGLPAIILLAVSWQLIARRQRAG